MGERQVVKVLELASNELLQQVSALYQVVWKNDDNSIIESIQKHSSYEGFKGFIALSEEDNVIGFSYGYTSLPGQFYHELLAKEFNSEECRRWLSNCFEYVELAVHPSYRKQGIGKKLITKLLEVVENETIILTTEVDNTPARSLYESLHWKVIKDSFYPSDSKQRYLIMGKEL